MFCFLQFLKGFFAVVTTVWTVCMRTPIPHCACLDSVQKLIVHPKIGHVVRWKAKQRKQQRQSMMNACRQHLFLFLNQGFQIAKCLDKRWIRKSTSWTHLIHLLQRSDRKRTKISSHKSCLCHCNWWIYTADVDTQGEVHILHVEFWTKKTHPQIN